MYSFKIKNLIKDSFYKMLRVLLISTLFLTGCTSTNHIASVRMVVDVPAEVDSISKHLNCSWQKMPDPMYPAKGHDYSCVADPYASVILFVASDENVGIEGNKQAIKKIKLIWKEWDKDSHIIDAKPDASRFIAYLAQRFFEPSKATKLVDTFFGDKDKVFTYKQLKVTYQHRQKPMMALHRLEIENTNKHGLLYAHLPPHEITK